MTVFVNTAVENTSLCSKQVSPILAKMFASDWFQGQRCLDLKHHKRAILSFREGAVVC